NVVNQSAGLRVHRATECADHAGSDACLKAERISDRDHQLADPQVLGVGQTHIGKLRRINPNNRKIGIWIIACQLRWIFASIGQIYSDRIRRLNDVAIGQNESIRSDNKTRAVTAELARPALDVDALFDVDVYHRRGNTRNCTNHGTRVRIEQDGIVLTWFRLDLSTRRRWSVSLRLV